MRHVVKWASTYANQTSGSDGQIGESLTDTLATAAVAVKIATEASMTCSSSDINPATRQGHQCRYCVYASSTDTTNRLLLNSHTENLTSNNTW